MGGPIPNLETIFQSKGFSAKDAVTLASIIGIAIVAGRGLGGFLLDYFYPFYPAQGLPLPVRYLEELERASQSPAPRLFYLIGQ